ncbi:hypothetical protein L484_000531 [Morus notabilis]|uniref:Uncharacterized protein n=1 Tax=Morus notabilis TaxID=981085 RepID=W9SDP6_9ROSA|nr:hypothetical protein L484_000531 [Morus notabilis]
MENVFWKSVSSGKNSETLENSRLNKASQWRIEKRGSDIEPIHESFDSKRFQRKFHRKLSSNRLL